MSADARNEFERFIETLVEAAQEQGEMPKMVFLSSDVADRFPDLAIRRLERLMYLKIVVFDSGPRRGWKFRPDLLDYCLFAATFFVALMLITRWI